MTVEKVDFYFISPEDIVKYLPAKDCGSCGYESCLDMSKVLSEGRTEVNDCPEIALRMAESLKGALSIKLEAHEADASMAS